jgi:hypothetical protein
MPEQRPAALIVGEALFCSSLRAYLAAEGGFGPAAIGTFFPQGKELLGPGDHLFASEDDARKVLSASPFTWILADPLIKDLVPQDSTPRFTPIPHRAISGRLYHESRVRFFSGGNLLQALITIN